MPDFSEMLNGIDLQQMLIVAVGFFAVSLVLGYIGKTMSGPNSGLSNAVSSAIGILFIYVATICVMTFGELAQFEQYLSPLPFISIENEQLTLFVFETAAHNVICAQLISMIILAFLVNLLDTILPRGRNIIVWFFLRCATVVLSILAHWFVTGLLTAFLPDVIVTNAATILLGILILLLAVGALKFLVGAALTTFNPIIGVLYTFFFANVIGMQLGKAVVTTALLSALVYALNVIGISSISIAIAALTGYVPFLAILAAAWYILNQVL